MADVHFYILLLSGDGDDAITGNSQKMYTKRTQKIIDEKSDIQTYETVLNIKKATHPNQNDFYYVDAGTLKNGDMQDLQNQYALATTHPNIIKKIIIRGHGSASSYGGLKPGGLV